MMKQTEARCEVLPTWCSGLLPSLIGVAHVAIQFPLYEALKSRLGEEEHDLSPLKLVSHACCLVQVSSKLCAWPFLSRRF